MVLLGSMATALGFTARAVVVAILLSNARRKTEARRRACSHSRHIDTSGLEGWDA
jgi:hypothetical protein